MGTVTRPPGGITQALDAGILTEAEAAAIAGAITEDADGAAIVDLGGLTDDELEAVDRLVVWLARGKAH